MNIPTERIRLNRYLAQSGLGSRRACEQLIRSGGVTVNGAPVRELGTTVAPGVDTVECDGQLVRPHQTLVTVMLHKPAGYTCTRHDQHARHTVLDLLPVRLRELGVVPVGRLDRDSTGLLLLSNDGELIWRLTHPSQGVEKVYLVHVEAQIRQSDIYWLENGIELVDGVTAPATVRQHGNDPDGSWLELVLHEGRKRQVRRMCATLGLPVTRLQRIAVGRLSLGGLAPGEWRELAQKELDMLNESVHTG